MACLKLVNWGKKTLISGVMGPYFSIPKKNTSEAWKLLKGMTNPKGFFKAFWRWKGDFFPCRCFFFRSFSTSPVKKWFFCPKKRGAFLMLLFGHFACLPNQTSQLTLDQLEKNSSPASFSLTSWYFRHLKTKVGHFGGMFFLYTKIV